MRRVPTWRTASTAAGLAALLVCSACTATTSNSSSAGAKEFTYWSMWNRTEPQAKALQASIDSFTKSTGIKVDVQWQGRSVLDKVGPALLSGNEPDLVDQSLDQLQPALGDNGEATNLSPVLSTDTGDGSKVSDVIPAKLMNLIPKDKGGKPWMIPYTVSSISLFYNGADPLVANAPKTFSDLLAICRQAKTAGKACIGTDGDQGWATQYWLDYLLNRNGVSITTLAADKTGAAWKAPAVLKSVQEVEQLIKGGYLISGYDATKYPAQQNNWALGKSVFFLMGSWLPTETATYAPSGFDYRSVNFPTTSDPNNNAVDIAPFGFVVPKNAPHAAQAEQFITYFMQKSQLAGISTIAGNMTSRTDTAAPKALTDAAASYHDDPIRLADDNLDNDYLNKALLPTFNSLWLGTSDAATFVDKTAADSAAYWKAKG
ncbi:ABC transporter substrate-binding protein [Streptacidiphilus sp. PAMC 29251]